MGGHKPTFTPFASFQAVSPLGGHLGAVGRCRVHPKCSPDTYEDFEAIISKNIEQCQVDVEIEDEELKSSNKKLKKKFMKQGVAMAQTYLANSFGQDVSVNDIEIVLDASTIIKSEGCIAACLLDAGCSKIAVCGDSLDEMNNALEVAGFPRNRVIGHFDLEMIQNLVESSTSFTKFFSLTSSVSINFPSADITADRCTDFMTKLSAKAAPEYNAQDIFIVAEVPSTVENRDEFVSAVSKFCFDDEAPCGTVALIDPNAEQLGMAFGSCIRTDREDGLYTTVVCTRNNEALGLVYSSRSSIVAALECGRGVYWSRSRNGLWRKGDTSGRFQTLHRIGVDCDGDAIRFLVTQNGEDIAAFCHLDKFTCWGHANGVRHLQETLKSRLKDAPAGSYTKRLFDDEELLRDKLVEEAQELSEANEKQHVAEELADVLYFAMVKAVKAGVTIDDAVAELDKRTRKVTRRKGDSKAFRIAAGKAILEKKK